MKWRECLKQAGLPNYWHPRCIGPEQMRRLEHLKTERPDLWRVFKAAFDQNRIDLARRFIAAGQVDWAENLLADLR